VAGLTAVQSRISEIQARFLVAPRPAASADWTTAATAAGLTGTTAAAAPGSTTSASTSATAR
jgi:peptidoglycan DL-endopeptidase CwlO